MTEATERLPSPYGPALRTLHYILMALVTGLALTGFAIYFRHQLGLADQKMTLVNVHAPIAYALLSTLCLRVVLSVVKPRQAALHLTLPRAQDFKRLPGELLRVFADRKKVRIAGRSPISRTLAGTLYAAFFIMAATGLFRAGTDLYHPPVGPLIANYIAADGVDPASLRPSDTTGVDPRRGDQVMRVKIVIGQVHIFTGMLVAGLALLHGIGVTVLEWSRRGSKARGPARQMLFGSGRGDGGKPSP